MKNIFAYIATNRQYIGQVATGHSIWVTISWVYDNPLYIAAIAIYGPVAGGVLMTFGSLIISWGMVLLYNKKRMDWLGVGAFDALRPLAVNYTEKLME